MAVTFMTGFEAQQAATDGGFGFLGISVYSTGQARTGAASLRCYPGSGSSGYITGLPTSATYLHFGLYVATLPSTARVVVGSTAAGYVNVRVTSTGALAFYTGSTLVGTTSDTPFSTPGWHWVGVRMATGTSVVLLQVDGADAVTGTNDSATNIGYLGVCDVVTSAIDIYIDDIIYDDTGFLAPSKVALLVPISDYGSSGGWRLGDATALGGNGYAAVDSIPPAGVASANETATTNIEHPGGSLNSYDVNLTTYTTAGIVAADTILAYQGFVRHGEDISTGTKNGEVQPWLNPNSGTITPFTFGDNAGAHSAEVGLWATAVTVLLTAPSVTLGSSPVLRVNRAGTESRVGCVDFMGAYVAWTPLGVTTVQAFAQAQAKILLVRQAFSQAQARIKTTYRVYAQALASIKHTYPDPWGSKYYNVIIKDSPLAYWRLGESSGYPQDSIGVAHASAGTGTLGAAGAIAGDRNTACSFDGASNYWSIPDAVAPDPADVFTVEVWAKLASNPTGIHQLLRRGTNAFSLGYNGSDQGGASNTFYLAKAGGAQIVQSNITITDTNWHHIVATKDGTSVYLYIDGVDRSGTVTNLTLTTCTDPMYIAENQSGGQFWYGSLDEAAIYGYALTSDRVASHYQAGISEYASQVIADSPISYWRLGETSGTNAADIVGGQDGTYTNTPTLGVAGAIYEDSDTAVTFSSSGLHQYISTTATLPTSAFTLEAWTKGSYAPGDSGLIGQWSANQGAFIYLNASTDYIQVWYNASAVLTYIATGILRNGNWHYISSTYDGSYLRLFLDGVLVAGPTSVGTPTVPATSFLIGQYASGGQGYFDGSVDEAALYDYALTPEQILNHYQIGASSSYKPTFALAQATIKQTYPSPHAQAQAKIISRAQIFAQAQAKIRTTVRVYAQALADIKQTYPLVVSRTVDISSNSTGALSSYPTIAICGFFSVMYDTWDDLGNVDSYVRYDLSSLSGTVTSATLYLQGALRTVGVWNCNFNVLKTVDWYPLDTGDWNISGTTIANFTGFDDTSWHSGSLNTAAVQASLGSQLPIVLRWDGSNSSYDYQETHFNDSYLRVSLNDITGAFAQAQAKIIRIGQGYAQAQARAKQIYKVYAQAQAKIWYPAQKSYAQSNADIKQTYPLNSPASSTIYLASGSDDGYALANSGGTPIGSSTSDTYLYIGDSGDATYYRIFLRFNLSSIPASATCTSASLYLSWQGQANDPLYVYETTSDWSPLDNSDYNIGVNGPIGSFNANASPVSLTTDIVDNHFGGYLPLEIRRQSEAWDGGWDWFTAYEISTTASYLVINYTTPSGAFAQAQAKIIRTAQGFAQVQARVKQTYQVNAQAQASIYAPAATYQGFAQAQVNVKAVSLGCAQAQSWIKSTGLEGFAQSQAWIRTEALRGYAQARTDIKVISNIQAQAQARIKQVYRGYAQARTDIKVITRVSAQAQVDIKVTSLVWAQAIAWIKHTANNGYAQSQGQIIHSYQIYAQAQADIKTINTVFAQAATAITGVFLAYAQAQASIKTTSNGYAQAQASINRVTLVYAQAQSWIKTSVYSWAQSNARIKVEALTKQAQAQAWIRISGYGWSQAIARIVRSELGWAQSRADIKTSYRSYAQSIADIKTSYKVYAQAQADIEVFGSVFAQAQATVKHVYQVYAQAMADIKVSNVVAAQARAWIELTTSAVAQAQAWLRTSGIGAAQAQATIKTSGAGNAQAQVYIYIPQIARPISDVSNDGNWVGTVRD